MTTPALDGRVLLAATRPDDLTTLRTGIERAGASVSCVEDGEQAVQAALAGAFDLVLLDSELPRLDGPGAMRLLRGAGYGGPLAALVAAGAQADAEACRQSGCSDWLERPVDPACLRGLLGRHLPAADARQLRRDQYLRTLLQQLRSEFLAGLPATIATLQEALHGRQWEALRHDTHRIKGLAGSLGYPAISRLAEPIETWIEAHALAEAGAGTQALLAALLEVGAAEEGAA